MASVTNIAAEIWDLTTPIIVGCNRKVAERLLALPTNQTLYLPSLPPSFHAGSTNAPGNDTHPNTNDDIYFALPIQPLHPNEGYVFSRSEPNADFQLPEEVPPTTSAVEFRIIINERLEWTLVDESITGTSVNGTKLYSTENQNLLAHTGYCLSNPQSQIPLRTEQANAIRVGWGALHFELYILRKPANYQYHPCAQNTTFSPTLPQPSQHLTGTHVLRTTEDIDAELCRQTGGDLTKGFYIDPARFTKDVSPCQQSVLGGAGGDMDMGVDDQDWTVLDGLGQLSLQGEDGGLYAMES